MLIQSYARDLGLKARVVSQTSRSCRERSTPLSFVPIDKIVGARWRCKAIARGLAEAREMLRRL